MTPDVRDIITTFAADGRSPQETAEALSLYREDVYDSIKEEAGPNVRDAWAATEGLNANIQEGLDALRDSSILSFVDQKIPDPATQNEFWTQIKNEQPIDGRFGVTEQDLAGVTNDPTFRLKSDSTAPTNVDAGQRRLFSYQIRPRQNETFEALVSSPERGDMLLSFTDPKPEQIDEMAVKLEETRKQNARDVLGVDIRAGADYTDLGDEDVETLALQEGPSNLSAEDTAARRDAQQQLRLTMAKLAALRGPQGRDFARNELLVERMKQDDMIDFVGGRGVGDYAQDLAVGLSMFGLGTAQTAAMATGSEDEARGLAQLNQDIQETTGSFGVQFSGGTLQRSVRGALVSVGMMAPALALGPAGRVAGIQAGTAETVAIGSLAPATFALSYNESMQEADTLEQQGRLEEAQKIRNRSSIRAVADTVFELGVERINPFFSQVGAAGWARRLPKQVFQEAIVEEPLTMLLQQEVSNPLVDRPASYEQLPEVVLSAAIATTGTQAVTGVVSSMLPKTPQPMASEVTPADVTRNVAAAASGMPVEVNPQAIRPQDAGAVTAAAQTNPETLAAVVAMTTNTTPVAAPQNAPVAPPTPAPVVTPPEVVAGVDELTDAEALAIDAELGINPDLGTGEFSERDAMRIIGQEQPTAPTPNEQNQTPPIQQEQSSGQNVPQPRRMPLLSEVQDAPQPQAPPVAQPASAQSGLTAIPAQTQTQEGLLAPTVAPSPEGAAISPQPIEPSQSNAQNQIQETGGTPAIQGVPTVSQPEGQTQAGTAQRSGQGQEVVRDATKPEQMTPEEFDRFVFESGQEEYNRIGKSAAMRAGTRDVLSNALSATNPVSTTLFDAETARHQERIEEARSNVEKIQQEPDTPGSRKATRLEKAREKLSNLESNQLQLPEGYVKQGDLYVFQPAAPPATSTSPALQNAEQRANVAAQETGNSPEVELQAIIQTPQYGQEWLQEQVEQARAEGVQAGDTVVAQDEAGETIVGTVAATSGETTTVSTTSGDVTVPTAGLVRQAPQSLSRKPGLAQALMESDGAALQLGISQQDVERGIAATRRQIPGANNIWFGSRQAFLDTFGNDPAVQDMVQQLEEGVMTEGFYVPLLQRGFLFTDSVVVYQGDADRAALNGTTPAVEAAKRLIRHEVGGHGGWMTLTQKQQQQFMDIARDVIPISDMNQMIEDGYPFQDWQTDEEIYRQAAEEWFSQRIGRMDKLPETGPMARFVDWLKGVWRWLTGRKGDPDLDAIKNLWRQIRMNQAAMATGRAWYSLPRQGAAQQVSDASRTQSPQAARHAELEAKHNAGTITAEETAEAQALVNEAAKAAGFTIEGWHGTAYKFTVPRGNRGVALHVALSREIAEDFAEEQAKNVRDIVEREGDQMPEESTDPIVLKVLGSNNLFDPRMQAHRSALLDKVFIVDGDAALQKASYITFEEQAGVLDAIKQLGFDGYYESEREDGKITSYAIFNPNKVKSADPFIGVPLDERFDSTSSDIRYSRQRFAPENEAEQKAFDSAKSNRVMARNPELAVAAVRLKNGEITAEQYADLVDAIDPFTAKGADPVPSNAKIKQYISSDKAPQVGSSIPIGKQVEFRIDIPTYNRSTAVGDTVYAITAHEPVSDTSTRVGTPISYLGIAKVVNPTFMTRSISGKGSAIDIATGAGKFPLATVKGAYEPISAIPIDISDPNTWTEVGYNPIRSSAFVDVRSKQEVVGGSEAIMVGSRVFVKNAVMQPRATGFTRGIRYSRVRSNAELLQNTKAVSFIPMEPETASEQIDVRDSIYAAFRGDPDIERITKETMNYLPMEARHVAEAALSMWNELTADVRDPSVKSEMTPEEAVANAKTPEEVALAEADHRDAITQAINFSQPVSAEAVARYGIAVPDDYALMGALYARFLPNIERAMELVLNPESAAKGGFAHNTPQGLAMIAQAMLAGNHYAMRANPYERNRLKNYQIKLEKLQRSVSTEGGRTLAFIKILKRTVEATGANVVGALQNLLAQKQEAKIDSVMDVDQTANEVEKISNDSNPLVASELTDEIAALWDRMMRTDDIREAEAIADVLKSLMPRRQNAKRQIASLFPQAGIRDRMNQRGTQLVRNFFQMLAGPRDQSGPLAQFDDSIQSALSEMLRKVVKDAGLLSQNESNQPDAVDKIVRSLSSDPLRFDKIEAADALMQQELDAIEDVERREVLRQAWEEATASMRTNIANPAWTRRAVNDALAGAKVAKKDWKAAFDTGTPRARAVAAIRQKAIDDTIRAIESRLTVETDESGNVLPRDTTVQRNLDMIRQEVGEAFDQIAEVKYASWLRDRARATEQKRLAAMRASIVAALRKQKMSQDTIDRLEKAMAEPKSGFKEWSEGTAPATKRTAKPTNPLRDLIDSHSRLEVPDFIEQAVAAGLATDDATRLRDAITRYRNSRYLAPDSPLLSVLFNQIKNRVAGDIGWADLISVDQMDGQRRQEEIFKRIRNHDALKGLDVKQQVALTNALNRLWLKKKQEVMKRELQKLGLSKGGRDPRVAEMFEKVADRSMDLVEFRAKAKAVVPVARWNSFNKQIADTWRKIRSGAMTPDQLDEVIGKPRKIMEVDVRNIIDSTSEILRYMNLGMWSAEALRDSISEKYGVKSLNSKEAKEIEDLARQAYNAEPGLPRDKLLVEIMRRMADFEDVSLIQLFQSFRIANLLFSARTFMAAGLTILNSARKLLGIATYQTLAAQVGGSPERAEAAWVATKKFFQAMPEAATNALAFLTTGDFSLLPSITRDLDDAFKSGRFGYSAVQMAQNEKIIKGLKQLPRRIKDAVKQGEVTTAIRDVMMSSFVLPIVAVQRIMGAIDLFVGTVSRESVTPLVAALNPDIFDLKKVLAEQRPEAYRKAYEQAQRELFGRPAKSIKEKAEASTRAREYIARIFDPYLLEEADAFAAETTYQVNPTGVGGLMYSIVQSGVQKLSAMTKQMKTDLDNKLAREEMSAVERQARKLAVAAMRFIAEGAPTDLGVRFIRFTGNRVNELISLTPVLGLLRLKEQSISQSQIKKATLAADQAFASAFALFAMAFIMEEWDDDEKTDEERGWYIEGPWNGLTPAEKDAAFASGKKPYTFAVRVGGKWLQFNYREWQTAGLFTTLGAMMDRKRYQREAWEEQGIAGAAISGIALGLLSFKDMSSMSQMMTLAGNNPYERDPVQGSQDAFGKFAGGYASSMFPTFVRDVDYMMNPEHRKAEFWHEQAVMRIPFGRLYAGQPDYDFFMEPVLIDRGPLSRVVSERTQDPARIALGKLNTADINATAPNLESRIVGRGMDARPMTTSEKVRFQQRWNRDIKRYLVTNTDRLLRMKRDDAQEKIRDDIGDIKQEIEDAVAP